MSNAQDDDYYALLGVSSTASTKLIRIAYKNMALKVHPDKQKTEEDRNKMHEVFAKVNQAHDVLTDPGQRRAYDRKLSELRRAKERAPNCPPKPETKHPGEGRHGHTDGNSTRSNRQRQSTRPAAAYSTRTTGSRQDNTSRTKSQPGFSSTSSSYQSWYTGHDYGGQWQYPPRASSFNDQWRSWQSHSHRPFYAHGPSQKQQQRPDYTWNKCGSGNSARPNSHAWGRTTGAQGGPSSSGRTNPNTQWQGTSSPFSSSQHRTSSSQQPFSSSRTPQGTSSPSWQPNYASSSFSDEHNRSRKNPQDESSKQSQSSSSRQQVFGIRRDGQPCLRCLQQKRYCYQHEDQNPASHHYKAGSNERYKSGSSTSENQSRNCGWRPPVYGVRLDGQPCKRCLLKNGYCYQHEHQDPQNRHHRTTRGPQRAQSTSRQRASSNGKCQSKIFGLRKDGQPCQRCINLGRYCHQHIDQKP